MQRIAWIDKRLEAWALWLACSRTCTNRGFEYSEWSMDGRLLPVELDAETDAQGRQMDAAIAALPTELSDMVVAYYTWGGGISQIVEKFRITRATVHRRLCHADLRLADWLNAQKKIRETCKNNFATYT